MTSNLHPPRTFYIIYPHIPVDHIPVLLTLPAMMHAPSKVDDASCAH